VIDIRVINLERALDRRKAVSAQLETLGLAATFVAAVDGQRDDFTKFSRHINDVSPVLHRPLTAGELGCFASHYLLWQECAAREKPMLILEDDCLLGEGAKETVTLLPELLESYPFLRLAGLIPRPIKVLRPLPGGHSLARLAKGPLGTAAYALSPAGAERLLRVAERWREPVDNYVDAFWLHGLLPIAVIPYPVGLTGATSLIGDSRIDSRPHRALCRKVYRHTQSMRRWIFKLSPVWREAT
jgi:glycosyl transferase family 25